MADTDVSLHVGVGPSTVHAAVAVELPSVQAPRDIVPFGLADTRYLGEAAPLLDRSAPGLGRAVAGSGLVADAAALVVAAACAALVAQALHPAMTAFAFGTTFARLLPAIPVLVGLLATTRHHRTSLRSTVGHQVAGITPMLAVGGLACIGAWRLANALGAPWPPPTDSLLLLCLVGLATVSIMRSAHVARPWSATGRRVIIVGSGLVAKRVSDQLGRTPGMQVVGFVDDDPTDDDGWVGPLETLAAECEDRKVSHVVVAFSRSSEEQIIDALRPLQGNVAITVIPRLFDVLPSTAALHDLGSGLTGISMAPAVLGTVPRAVKRSIDVVGSGSALLLLSPLLLLTAAAVKLTSRGPVLFRQKRTGRDGRVFHMVKFRSMNCDAARRHPSAMDGQITQGPFPKLKDDPRITALGRFIRRTSVDELPQLWNVLKGDMSLVGPRPFIPEESASITGWAECRYDVRPGITGLWQVSGRNELTFEEMCRLDGIYVANWSTGLDFRILLRTLRAVWSRHGAY